jgi:hypothetical protein
MPTGPAGGQNDRWRSQFGCHARHDRADP